MKLEPYFKSVLEQDKAPVVICNLEHDIIYMNPSSIKKYEKNRKEPLLGKSIFNCHPPKANEMIVKVVKWFGKSDENNIIHTFYNEKENRDVYMVALRDDNKKLIGYYEKHEFRNKETESFYDFK